VTVLKVALTPPTVELRLTLVKRLTSLGYGYWLKAKRERLGLSVSYVAERLGITNQSLYNWEKDANNPQLENLHALAEVYQCLVGDLLPHTEYPGVETPQYLRPLESTLAPYTDDVRNRLVAFLTGQVRTMAGIFLGKSPFLVATETASPPYNMATPHSSTSVQGDSAAIPFSGGVRVREESGGREESGTGSAAGGNHPQPPPKARKRRP
jgi:transcriptional regulator with XRE-family HTH domain